MASIPQVVTTRQCAHANTLGFQARLSPVGRRSARTVASASPLTASTSTQGLTRRALLQQQAAALLLACSPGLVVRSAGAAGGPKTLSPEAAKAVDAVLEKFVNKGKAPVILRLVFHDAGTYRTAVKDGGLNASIRFELDRPENFGLKRGWRVIEQIQTSLAGTPAASLSYADLIALAGARAVAVCNGPKIAVPIGRVDATEASGDPEGRLPPESVTVEQLKAVFGGMGLSVQETVALLGAHTIGSKGFGDPAGFDNTYFVELLKKPWLNTKDPMASMIGLPSDHVLPDDPDFLKYIEQYAADQGAFFRDFSSAYVKLTSLGVMWA